MPKSKRQVVLAAINAYADPYDPDGPNNGNEVIEATIEFLETFAGLDLDACISRGANSYELEFLLGLLDRTIGSDATAAFGFLRELGLIREDRIYSDASDSKQPELPGVAKP